MNFALVLALPVLASLQGRSPLDSMVESVPIPVRSGGELEPSAPSVEARVRASFDPFGETDHGNLAKGTSVFSPPDDAPPGGFYDGGNDPQPQLGGPVNDNCFSATVIPSNAVHYSQITSSVGASSELCEGAESCEASGVGTSRSIWWEYVPERDGRIVVDTIGSSFNTVLSVFNGCGAFVGLCFSPTELACNDDYFFGTNSLVSVAVEGGEVYKIKVAQYGSGLGGTVDLDLYYYPANDACADAKEVYGVAFSDAGLSTHNAQTDLCEADESCEFNGVGVSNAVWYSFTAPCDGTLDINTNGTTYDTLLSIWDGCGQFVGVDANCVQPNEIACDDDGGTGLSSQLVDVPVVGGNEYLIKISDYNTSQGGGYVTFNALFQPAAPPVASLASPVDFACVCVGTEVITGSANAGAEALAEWRLEYQPLGGSRSLIASGTQAVQDGTLGAWNTAGLSEGYYYLHLSVVAACGATSTTTRIVRVSASFDLLEIQAPSDETIVGGLACVEGTALDGCFDSYTVEVAPAGSGNYSQIHMDHETKTNETLVPSGWDTTGLSDGLYSLRLSAQDTCGNSTEIAHNIVVDNTPPTAVLTEPLNCTAHYGTVDVVGQVADANLGSWVLQHTNPNGPGWVTIASGTGVASGVLATLDMATLPRCAYTLRLRASDMAVVNCDDPNSSEYTVSITNKFPPGAKKTTLVH